MLNMGINEMFTGNIFSDDESMIFGAIPEKTARFRRRADEESHEIKWLNRGMWTDGANTRIAVDKNGKRYVNCKVVRSHQNDDRKLREKRRTRRNNKAEVRRMAEYEYSLDYDGIREYVEGILANKPDYYTGYDESIVDEVSPIFDTWSGYRKQWERGSIVRIIYKDTYKEYPTVFTGMFIPEKDLIDMGFVR